MVWTTSSSASSFPHLFHSVAFFSCDRYLRQFCILKLIPYVSISEIGDWNLHKVLFPVLKKLCFRQEQTWFSIIIKAESVYLFITGLEYKGGCILQRLPRRISGSEALRLQIPFRYQVAMQHIWLEAWQMSSLPLWCVQIWSFQNFYVHVYFCTTSFSIHIEQRLPVWESFDIWVSKPNTVHISQFRCVRVVSDVDAFELYGKRWLIMKRLMRFFPDVL